MANKKTSGGSKRSSKKTARPLPTVRAIRYRLTNSGTPGTETSHYVDLARDLSVLNRKLYRQGRMYHVKKITIVSTNTFSGFPTTPPGATQNAGSISASVVPYNWVSQQAYLRAFRTWNKMNADATQQIAGDISGTWADFKVYMSTDSRTATHARPYDNGNNLYAQGEWEHSNLVTPDGTAAAIVFDLHMLGANSGTAPNYNSVGLIKSFGESRATVQSASPNVPAIASDDPLVNVFDYGTGIDDVIDLLEYENDAPLYDVAAYPGDDTNGPKPMIIQHSSIDLGRATLSGFAAMCGLVEFEIRSPVANDVYSVLVELAPGSFRGIKAEAI